METSVLEICTSPIEYFLASLRNATKPAFTIARFGIIEQMASWNTFKNAPGIMENSVMERLCRNA